MLLRDREWLERWLVARRARMRLGRDLTRAQLRRSRDQINKSYDLLKYDGSKVCPEQPPRDHEGQP